MQTLRKKTSPLKYKNETTRFLGDGVSFKAKLIGILEVSEARGDRMCQEALSDLKMAIRAAGEHKQRITINIAIDGLRLRDEKTGDSLYHHPVHKISFIAQDMTDSRAFGYIFGSPDTGHRFFGIKTDKAASQVVIAMRDLFQVVFALKKKEIELAKQHLDKNRFTSSPLFSDSTVTSTKLQPIAQENSKNFTSDNKAIPSAEAKPDGTAVADLVDLELELNSLQQGLNQMERMTPSDPYGSKDDPFGDSFINYTKPILPPPPSSGRERSSRTSETSSLFSPRTPRTGGSLDTSSDTSLFNSRDGKSKKDIFAHELSSSQPESTSEDWFTQSGGKSIFEEPPLVPEPTKDEKHEMTKQEILSQFDVFTELDPLGSESAPEPPPRPESTLTQIKPPPLPPKKAGNDFSVKPPPRPPIEESHYDYMDVYQTAPSSLEVVKNLDKSPPIPVPARKTKFESDYGPVPERPKKQFNLHSSEEDYLTPICFVDQKVEPKTIAKSSSPILLPPPQKSGKKQNVAQVTIASYLDSKPNVTTSMAADNLSSLDGLDITLSQLTLSGLNELATKLNIPATQLSNMTLVQLTNYLSNFVKSRASHEMTSDLVADSTMPSFDADFAANFNNINCTTVTSSEAYDRYAVFRELINEEIKQTKIDTEPEEIQNEKENMPSSLDSNVNNVYSSIDDTVTDKYAALREIVESELKLTEAEYKDDNKNENDQNELNEEIVEEPDETTIINIENKLIDEEKDKQPISPKYNLIEYNTTLDTQDIKPSNEAVKSPKSPVNKAIKSPVPIAITDIMQSNVRLNSGSLSDVVSGSSPEVDNTGSNSEVGKKNDDAAGESWAIFDQGMPLESTKEKQTVQSEEGVSPWSSDSKEFGNGSPLEWQRGDSESGGDHWTRRRMRRDQEGWWDTSAEPEMQYYPSNRRSTDSYDDENYECYERPRRRKQTGYVHGGQGAGGHSSSSRDVSPWEEEPRRETRASWAKHARQVSLEKYRERRHADSWDDEDDYEYEEERVPRFHRSDRQKWEMDRERYDTVLSREHNVDKWDEEWADDRRHRRRREGERERWCCPDRDVGEHDKPSNRYNTGRWPHPDGPSGMWRDRKHDERYYSRESQESPWEDEYSNEAEEISTSHYLTAKRNWKRPSSASEMDRKTGEIRSRHYLATGGSDGERDRRYKPARRSRSRDSQYSETSYRHKTDAGPAPRGPHRNKQYCKTFENDFADVAPKKQVDASKLDYNSKKCATLTSRKKTKESPKADMNIVGTFPRKSSSRSKSLFENDFVSTEESTPNLRSETRFNFENEFETSEAESPTVVNKSVKALKQHSLFEKTKLDTEFNKDNYRPRSLKELKLSPRLQNKSKSLFEDDFSPSGKSEPLPKDNSISSIKEVDSKAKEGSLSTNNFENATNCRRKKPNKHRLSNNIQSDINIKKSESVNIFARESDPFDDDFFSENMSSHENTQYAENSPKPSDLKWTEDFEEFPAEEK
ncbi:protein disabled isoform X4 [Zophobas morio]|uniref:protein disabled isoform X4 n=1 Tax=Zophobas morio TaxID=2755281 RepID=UPI0030833A37